MVLSGGREMRRKETNRERNMWKEKRPKWVTADNEDVRWEKSKGKRSERAYHEKDWRCERKYCFPWLEEDNIYRSYAPCEREIVLYIYIYIFLENNL